MVVRSNNREGGRIALTTESLASFVKNLEGNEELAGEIRIPSARELDDITGMNDGGMCADHIRAFIAILQLFQTGCLCEQLLTKAFQRGFHLGRESARKKPNHANKK